MFFGDRASFLKGEPVTQKNRQSPIRNPTPILAPKIPPTIAPALTTGPLGTEEGELEALAEWRTVLEATIQLVVVPAMQLEP